MYFRMIIIILLCFNELTAQSAYSGESKFTGVLDENDILMDRSVDYKLEKNLINNGEKKVFQTLVGTTESIRVEIHITKGLDKSESQRIISNYRSGILSQFENKRTPYPGEISNLTTCDGRYRPVVKKVLMFSKEAELILAAANKRYSFGVCEQKMIEYRAGNVFHFDNIHGKLTQIQIFIKQTTDPNNDYLQIEKLLKSFKLKNH